MQEPNSLWKYIARNYHPTGDHLAGVNDQFKKMGNLNFTVGNANEYFLILLANQPLLYPYLALALNHDIDLNVHNIELENALFVAHRSSNFQAVKLLLEYKKNGKDKEPEEISATTLQNALFHIIKNKSLQYTPKQKASLQLMWEKFYQQFRNEYHAFTHKPSTFKTICEYSPFSYEFLFAHKFQPLPDIKEEIPLLGIAIRLEKLGTVTRLLKAGFDPNVSVNGIPLLACVTENIEIVIALINYGAKAITSWHETQTSYQDAIKMLKTPDEILPTHLTQQTVAEYKSVHKRLSLLKKPKGFFDNPSLVLDFIKLVEYLQEIKNPLTPEGKTILHRYIAEIEQKDSQIFNKLVRKFILKNILNLTGIQMQEFTLSPPVITTLNNEAKNIQHDSNFLFNAALCINFAKESLLWLKVAYEDNHQQAHRAIQCGLISPELIESTPWLKAAFEGNYQLAPPHAIQLDPASSKAPRKGQTARIDIASETASAPEPFNPSLSISDAGL